MTCSKYLLNGVQRIDVKVKRRGLTWKVDEADTFLSKNFSVAVPKGAEIKIDGITPDSKLKSQDEIEGMDTYTIKKIFGTSHYRLRILHDMCCLSFCGSSELPDPHPSLFH